MEYLNAVIHESSSINFVSNKIQDVSGVLFGVSLDEKTLLKCVDMEISEIIQSFDVSEEAAHKIFAAIALSRFITGGKAERKSINCPGDIADVLMPRMQGLKQEVLLCLALDTKGKVTESMQATVEDCETIEFDSDVLHIGKIFEGTLNFCTFHPREIFRFAISCNANSIVIAHNHPSGDPTPSQEDVKATKQLMEAGDHIGIKLLDHIIIGNGKYQSLKEEGVI